MLLEELRAQRSPINKLHDEAGHLLSHCKDSERTSLLSKLNCVEDLWTELHNQLENRRRQIENAGFAGQVFGDSYQTLQAWLDGIGSLYENFAQVDNLPNPQKQLQVNFRNTGTTARTFDHLSHLVRCGSALEFSV